MVFGFGEGKIDLVLESFNFKPGDVIKGKLVLDLKKPKKARELRLVFEGVETRTRMHRTRKGNERKTDKVVIYSFKLSFGGEKEYSGRTEYDFEINIPQSIMPPAPDGTLRTALNIVQFMGGTQKRIDWVLNASLNIPGGFDVSKSVQINIG